MNWSNTCVSDYWGDEVRPVCPILETSLHLSSSLSSPVQLHDHQISLMPVLLVYFTVFASFLHQNIAKTCKKLGASWFQRAFGVGSTQTLVKLNKIDCLFKILWFYKDLGSLFRPLLVLFYAFFVHWSIKIDIKNVCHLLMYLCAKRASKILWFNKPLLSPKTLLSLTTNNRRLVQRFKRLIAK